MNQLLATFFVQSPELPHSSIAVTAQVQHQSGTQWFTNTNELVATVTPANYQDAQNLTRFRYRIDVFRVESEHYDYNISQTVNHYALHRVGTYRRRLRVLFNNAEVLTRMIYITVQPDIGVTHDHTIRNALSFVWTSNHGN